MFLSGFIIAPLFFANSLAAPSKSQIQNCTNRYNQVKYRSQILAIYKQNEDKKYKSKRTAWAKSIAYNARWEPKQGQDVRDKLYELDSLHSKTMNEIDRQIDRYKTLQYQEIDCTKLAKNQVLESKIREVNESEDSGNGLINKYRLKESAYLQKDFKKSLNKLVKSSFKQRDDFKAPETPPLIVKKYTETQ